MLSKSMFKNPLEDIEYGLVTTPKIANRLKIIPESYCDDGYIYFIKDGRVISILMGVDDDGTRKDIQEQDNAETEVDTQQLVGVDSTGDNSRDTGYLGLHKGEVYSFGTESRKGETEPITRTEN